MAELKTKPTSGSVEDFLNAVPDEQKRLDSFTLLEMMRQVTGKEPVLWGSSIVGFGEMHYQYESGREGDWFQMGFSPRKQALTLYFGCQAMEFADLLPGLGKHSLGKGCLYIKRLSDVDTAVLRDVLSRALEAGSG